MTQHRPSRREVLAFGSSTIVALAGCTGGSSNPSPNNSSDSNDDGEDVDISEWEGIDEFYFEGRIQAWTGIEPSIIADEDNPTLYLIEGEEYDFRWKNMDGQTHNLEIHDDSGLVVNDLVTEDVSNGGGEAMLENVVATEEMASYVCRYHLTTQAGDIEIISE